LKQVQAKIYRNTKDLKRFVLGLLCFVMLSVSNLAQDAVDSVKTDTIIDLTFVDEYDSLLVAHFSQLWEFRNQGSFKLEDESFTDSINETLFEERVNSLRAQTPFDFRYNAPTKAMINLYANKRKRLTAKMLSYKELYFPLFEEYLAKYELPQELKYLPIVESALNPRARSRVGAGGLWQFMPRTGEMYDLTITSYVDKRCDPYLATDAACQYLSFLHEIYHDWNLVLAAYNCGLGTVNKAIRRANGATNYWEIRHLLPKETQNYIPAFTAVNYVMNYYQAHDIEPKEVKFLNLNIDTVHVCKRIEFDVLEEWLGYEQHKLRYLNPMFINHVIPSTKTYYSLCLPRPLIGDFIQLEDSIYKYSSLAYQSYVAHNKLKRIQYTHIIKSGETLASIANKYNCTPEDIKAWNNRTSNKVYRGRKLVVFKETTSLKEVKASNSGAITNAEGTTIYTVKRGDTLWDIAQKYRGVSVNDIKAANGNMSSRLSTGQKIKIPIR
jgi:membrane-bound lytic murein transglycosylase D